MTNYSDSFGYVLKRYRKAQDLTQAELGRRAGCSAAAIRKIEADERKPSVQLAELLANQLNIPIDQRQVFLQLARHQLTPLPVLLPEEPGQSLSPEYPHNLPTPLTSLVDRTQEIQVIAHYLRDGSVRLLTLVGPPGIGKTRLCLSCGKEVRGDFLDGVWFVDLSTVPDAAFVLPAIQRALPMSKDIPAYHARERIVQAIKDKRMLLILDNFEHLVDQAAPDLVEILKACPDVKALVTSRVPLHVYGEHEYQVPALSIPPAERISSLGTLAEYEAVQLFVVRMRQHTPGFTITQENASRIVEICRWMEGIPLAIELAAATARRMSLDQITQVFHQESGQGWLSLFRSPAQDLPPRQRTLYGAITWSYDLLNEQEQGVLLRLGVFSGSFDTEAAFAVCQDVVLNPGILDSILEKLADQYLLSGVEENRQNRWRMLEMIREFALEVLAETGLLQEVQRRHAYYFSDRLTRLNEITSHTEYGLFSQLNSANLSAALNWGIRSEEIKLSLNLSSLMVWMWERLGVQQEGLKWMQKALDMPGEALVEDRVEALFGAANLSWQLNQTDRSLAWVQEAIDLVRAGQAPFHYLLSLLNQLGRIYIQQNRYDLARQALQECLSLAQNSPDLFNPGRPMTQLGELALADGRIEEAKSRLSAALDILSVDDHLFLATTRINLAEVAITEEQYALAMELLRKGFSSARLYFRPMINFYTALAGALIGETGGGKENLFRSVQLLGSVTNLSNRAGTELSPWYQERKQLRVELTQRMLPRGEWEKAWNTGYAWSKEEAEVQASSLLNNFTAG